MSILDFKFTKSELKLLEEKHKKEEEIKSNCKGCYNGCCEQCTFGWITPVSDEDYIRNLWIHECNVEIRKMDEFIQLENKSNQLHAEAEKALKAQSKFYDDMLSKLMLEREKQHLKELLDEMGE
jgi:hypothetical protein